MRLVVRDELMRGDSAATVVVTTKRPPLFDLPAMWRRDPRATGDEDERRIFESTVRQFTPVVAASSAACLVGALYALRRWRWKSRGLVALAAAFAGHWTAVLGQEYVILNRLRALPDPSPPPPPPPPPPKRTRWWA